MPKRKSDPGFGCRTRDAKGKRGAAGAAGGQGVTRHGREWDSMDSLGSVAERAGLAYARAPRTWLRRGGRGSTGAVADLEASEEEVSWLGGGRALARTLGRGK
eukprot:4611686-Pleurochrysis_carterae.AAC.1